MPAMRAFGRRWHIASDDFPLIAAGGLAFHFVWAVFISAALGLQARNETAGCPKMPSLTAYGAELLGADILMSLSFSLLFYFSLQGTMLDERPRRAVPYLLYMCIGSLVITFGVSCYGASPMFNLMGHLGTEESSCGATWNVVAFGRAAFAFHWLDVAVGATLLLVCFNPLPQHSELDTWQSRLNCIGAMCCCWSPFGSSSREPKAQEDGPSAQASGVIAGTLVAARSPSQLEMLATIFHVFLSNLDFAPSDFAAAMVLVGIKQRLKRRKMWRAASHSSLMSSGASSPDLAPAAAPVTCPVAEDPGKMGVAADDAAVVEAEVLLQERPPGPQILRDASHYSRYAFSVYGATIELTKPHEAVKTCGGCCLFSCSGMSSHPAVDGMLGSQNMTIKSICDATGMDMATDFLFISLKNQAEGLIPYFIGLDRQRREVLLSIRGSASKFDAMTDLICVPAKVDPAWIRAPGSSSPAGQQGGADGGGEDGDVHAHQGMLNTATAIARDLDERGVLRAVLEGDVQAQDALGHGIFKQDCRGWRLVVCGHSLGAGVAALLSLHLRGRYPDLTCWAFAPPGGLITQRTARQMASFCTSVIIGKDMVPRMTLRGMRLLILDLLEVASRCKVPKAKLWLHSAVFSKEWQEDELFKPEDEVPEDIREAFKRIDLNFKAAAGREGYSLEVCGNLMAPGRLLYYEKFGDKSDAAPIGVFRPRWMDNQELAHGGIAVSKRMVAMQ